MDRTRLALSSLRLAAAARRHLLPLIASLALSVVSSCAESGSDEEVFDPQVDAGPPPVTPPASTHDASFDPVVTADAGIPWTSSDAGSQSSSDAGSGATTDASSGKPGTSVSSGGADRDAALPGGGGLNIDEIIKGLFGDGGAPSPTDGGFTPPPDGGGEWSLNPGSFVDCPAEPPPIPIVGGVCLGIYYSCGWTNRAGQQYSCICDWIHWLCI